MAIDDRLTVLLPVKGRADFTVRWMRYADALDFPFKVLIADGGKDEGLAALLGDPKSFPRVDYRCLRYPCDADYTAFYSKLADAVCRVETPFTALVDNDDFFIVDELTA